MDILRLIFVVVSLMFESVFCFVFSSFSSSSASSSSSGRWGGVGGRRGGGRRGGGRRGVIIALQNATHLSRA